MKIKAVLFDLGGTLEDLSSTKEEQRAAIEYIQTILQLRSKAFCIPKDEFYEKLMAGYKFYKGYVAGAGIEKSPEDMWSEYYLACFPKERETIRRMSDHLTELWETNFFVRDAKKDALQMCKDLKQQGLLLGVITNTTSRSAPYLLVEKYGFAPYMDVVLCSAGECVRKPKPDMFLTAADFLGVEPAACAYIGDQVRKDMLGAYDAGYSVRLLIDSAFTEVKEEDKHLITGRLENLSQLPAYIQGINQ